jgi:hypothetical protein
MLGDVIEAIRSLDQMFATVGALGSFLSFLLAVYLEWGNIKARARGGARQVNGLASQSIYKTEPALRPPVGRYPTPKTPRVSIMSLVAKLFLDLVKTMFAIFMAIVVSAEYLLLADYDLGIGLPHEWLLIASLALGAILGAYLRARSWILLLLIGVLSQVGILALTGSGLQDVPAILESLVTSGLVAGLF